MWIIITEKIENSTSGACCSPHNVVVRRRTLKKYTKMSNGGAGRAELLFMSLNPFVNYNITLANWSFTICPWVHARWRQLMCDLRPHPHVSGNLWKRKFFFTNTGCVHTYPAYFPTVSGNFWKRSPEWKFFYPIRIRIRVDGRIRKFANTLTSFSLIQSSRRALNKHGVQQGCVFFVNCSDF